ncbi:hypothetical protein M3215_15885 [Bacillus cytotoxicus]|uniref:Uncharacterized protein n=1 Tax=Bacillus cytotoxicus TaxID=580165 RepID=A0ACC6A9I4_9BACI|nr:hypothetical protein [Bacillus cytotoxicus]
MNFNKNTQYYKVFQKEERIINEEREKVKLLILEGILFLGRAVVEEAF